MTSQVTHLPLSARPAFVRKMIAVWRWHHLAQGEDLVVLVYPGEWPDGEPREVKGIPVKEEPTIGGPGVVMVMGRVGEAWKVAYNMAVEPLCDMSPQDLAICTIYLQIDDSRDLRIWMHPSPETGEVPMWVKRR